MQDRRGFLQSLDITEDGYTMIDNMNGSTVLTCVRVEAGIGFG